MSLNTTIEQLQEQAQVMRSRGMESVALHLDKEVQKLKELQKDLSEIESNKGSSDSTTQMFVKGGTTHIVQSSVSGDNVLNISL